MNDIQISEDAVRARAEQLGRVQARAELEREAAQAAQARQDAERLAAQEYAARIAQSRKAVDGLASKYARRTELARQIGPLLNELVQLHAATGNELDASTQPTIAYGVHTMGRDAHQAARDAAGRMPTEIHATTGITPRTPDDEWAELVLRLVIHGHIGIGPLTTGGRGGRITTGTTESIYKFS